MTGRRALGCLLAVVALLGSAADAHAAFPGRDGRIAVATQRFACLSICAPQTAVVTSGPSGADARQIRVPEGFVGQTKPSFTADGAGLVLIGDVREAYDYDTPSRLDRWKDLRTGPVDGPVDQPVRSNDPDAPGELFATDVSATPSGGLLLVEDGFISAYRDADAPVPTFDAGEGVISAAISPDGRSIAYDRSVDGVKEVWLAAADGRGARRVATGALPDWSPDGKRLAYVTPDLGRCATHLLTVATGEDLALPLGCREAIWSPSGQRLAIRTLAGFDTVRPDGTGRRAGLRLGATGRQPALTLPGMSWQRLP